LTAATIRVNQNHKAGVFRPFRRPFFACARAVFNIHFEYKQMNKYDL